MRRRSCDATPNSQMINDVGSRMNSGVHDDNAAGRDKDVTETQCTTQMQSGMVLTVTPDTNRKRRMFTEVIACRDEATFRYGASTTN